MDIPFIPDQLFELNPDRSPVEVHENWISVDNFYKNYDLIFNVLSGMPKETWKYKEGSRNFVDYYDCRPTIQNHMGHGTKSAQENTKLLTHWINTYLRPDETPKKMSFDGQRASLDFNMFKFVKEYDYPYQHCIHKDVGWTAIIYLDKVADGGTALYKSPFKGQSEFVSVMQDVSKETLIEVIPAKPNRLAIFKGSEIAHSAWFNDHRKYIDNWRINQVIFLTEDD